MEDYETRGFLAAAVRNYISLLGWNPKDDREKLTIDETIELFDFPGINKGNARFDERKLSALNLRVPAELDIGSFSFLARPRLAESGLVGDDVSEDYLQAVLSLCQPKARGLDSLEDPCGYLFR